MKTYQEDPNVQKNRWWILISVAMFTFMSTLDSSIVNIALPTISKDMNVPMNQSEWVVSIYLMVVCACLLLFGKIGDSWGKIKVYRIGTVIFVFGSLLCGFNHSLGFLLFGRIVQALGASMTMASNSGIITEVFPLKERGRALGSIGAFVSLGSIAGPGIGGLILSNLSWSYIFWINIPVGIVTMLIGEKFLPKDITKSQEKIDYSGFATFAVTIMTFFGGIFMGQEFGFASTQTIVLVAIAIVSFILFLVIEKKKENPLIHFAIFKNKIFTMSLITAVLIFSSNFFVNVVIPFYLQDARHLSASYAGMLMMVFPLLMVVGSPLSGYLTDKIGPSILIVLGLAMLAVTQLMYMFMTETTPIWYYVVATGIMGLGNALFQSPNNTMVMSSVTKDSLGVAGSMNSFARNLGMVIGIALATTILYDAMSAEYGQRVTTFIADRPDIFITGMRITFLGSFLICAVAFILTIIRLRKKNK
ncbi:drug:H+ antiporter-2 (14 Spanner) (DHA2) family drug resistance MFS transporter [Enterococcus phoeniculicola]|jgi:EmrB/QacA subfamily drug resistance transporter|uniref:Drug:H+ antiporter-2 (14 Spanner) (DHA2) family drug resistance MFS transporter n=1 Tax=Enterococcus phoeniculicola ATCC BAA-412 TaxID=1158610 RepID=R3WQL4_9ENTE|nr:MFS transporter [Enterococcus phoeniculicola]EOL44120.1 drug:H+ antiporter-2 (14 Spanner) (DHA2) family drug resistance MFS transporter [Enterococcus phoeniculicola ATCC BAA-412]EOT75222.1 drug resistance MFS transporter [Enterococcus phoeniculicola ATCC BAA-412]OJG69475.1 drug:H+ antiporter-2 (14 Spanner) (DHA2) family drug resistance MFS transporter [Enterococcus phoeniculicola]